MENKLRRFTAALLALLLLTGCAAAIAEESWICPGCGKECHGNVCGNCGTVKPVWFCPVCMTENAGNFCTNCGYDHRNAAEATAASPTDAPAASVPSAAPAPTAPSMRTVPAADLKITGIGMNEDGSVHLTWTGGAAPYRVSYQRAAGPDTPETSTGTSWREQDEYLGEEALLTFVMPGVAYWFEVKDRNGAAAQKYFSTDSVPFSAFQTRLTVTLRERRGGKADTVQSFAAQKIRDGLKNGDARYGATIKVAHESIRKHYYCQMRMAVLPPWDDVFVIYNEYEFVYKGGNDSYTYWSFFDFEDLWQDLQDTDRGITPGKYTFVLCFDRYTVGTKEFYIQ